VNISPEHLAAMSDDRLAEWVTFHEQRVERESATAGRLRDEGPGTRSTDRHDDLIASALNSVRLSESALGQLRGELERRIGAEVKP
jgi:hypothetical protein